VPVKGFVHVFARGGTPEFVPEVESVRDGYVEELGKVEGTKGRTGSIGAAHIESDAEFVGGAAGCDAESR
jgi:hypothetical protein